MMIAMNVTGPLTTYGNAPAPRGGHTATFVGKKLFVFGGSAYSAKGLAPGGRESPLTIVKSDLHVLDLATMTWSIPAAQGVQPPPRYAHTATLMGNKVIVFGGFNGRVYLDDLSVLDTSMV
jgi:N-acetylneuraminic acid mutarotase